MNSVKKSSANGLSCFYLEFTPAMSVVVVSLTKEVYINYVGGETEGFANFSKNIL